MKRITFAQAGTAALALAFIMAMAGCPLEEEPPAPPNSGGGSYTVSFTAGEGSGTPPPPQTVPGNTPIMLPGQGDMTAPAGKTFDGWTNGRHYAASTEFWVSGTVTLTAQWTDGGGSYTVSFSAGEGSGTPPSPMTVPANTPITLPGKENMTAPAGKTFGGWSADGQNYAASDSYTVNSNVTLTAQWTSGGSYTVSYDAGEGSGTPPVSQTVSAGQSITLPGQENMTAPAGKTFDGWSADGQNYAASDFYTVNSNVTLTAQWTSQQWEEGIYIGLISFAGNSEDITYGAPIRLDSSGQSLLNYRLRYSYEISSQGGTALFYGVHQALANLKTMEANYPANLDSVNVITFTDGLDNGSTGKAAAAPIEGQSPDTTADYAEYVQGQIADRTIAGKAITAYSVGVRGSDVTDIAGFQNTLSQIASPGKANELTDFSQVQTTFTSIANGLNIVRNTSATFTMTTTLLENGAKVRMTFDDVTDDAASSARWIEGTVNRTGTGSALTYTLNSIIYQGMSSAEGAGPITGTINGSEVNFVFTDVEGLPDYLQQDDNRVDQWLQPFGSGAWQINSEYQMGNSVESSVEFSSSIIYLVLDSSRSLNTAQIDQIRTAVIGFINSLYSQITQ